MPAYDLISIPEYFLASVQFSSGCPFTCEFCDIPALYGRNPRLKSPEQVIAELDRLRAGGAQSVYFVDDNFIANPKAAEDLLPHVIAWQKRHRYPLRIACEATLNIAKSEQILALMRDAGFVTIFCGIETPEPAALHAMSKSQNLRLPILEAVDKINAYGMEVVSGIIIGLDTDTPDSADRIVRFIRESHIPILTINVLYALPKTPLWTRLERAGRIRNEAGRESNVDFLMAVGSLFVLSSILAIVGQVRVTAWCEARYRPPEAVALGLALMTLAFAAPLVSALAGHVDPAERPAPTLGRLAPTLVAMTWPALVLHGRRRALTFPRQRHDEASLPERLHAPFLP